MDIREREMPWVKRVEALIEALDGSTVGELELREAGTEIVIRRRPDLVLTSAPVQQVSAAQPLVLGGTKPTPKREERSQPVPTPITGVYYSSPSPTAPPFVNVGDVIHSGQVIALVEAMKVFNEIQSEIAGRVVALVAKNGDVVQKGSPLLKVEPL
ncbi:MAG TPA: biotin/lipoyl-containing protein [Ktedonobacteraceae bacterium]|nr:biotin/lipoyl-containing protein [Ktedonobacteraceae bacterium]